MTKKEKTYLEEMDRGVYDIKNKFTYKSKTEKGLTEDIVRQISKEKEEPAWMLESRLKALKIFNEKENPKWGPDISEVDMNEITTYIRPDAEMSDDWKNVPDDIRDTFDKLGIL